MRATELVRSNTSVSDIWTEAMEERNRRAHSGYVVCIDNADYAASLEKHKIYRVIDDAAADAAGDTRVIDESGEDYLYPADRFMQISVSAELESALAAD